MGTARTQFLSPCPTCQKPTERGRVVSETGADAFPFCCFRCQLVDLGRWLDEEYRIADPVDSSGGGASSLPVDDESDAG